MCITSRSYWCNLVCDNCVFISTHNYVHIRTFNISSIRLYIALCIFVLSNLLWHWFIFTFQLTILNASILIRLALFLNDISCVNRLYTFYRSIIRVLIFLCLLYYCYVFWCGLWLTTMVTVTATWCQLLSIGSKYAYDM